jgi:hypothetical protein
MAGFVSVKKGEKPDPVLKPPLDTDSSNPKAASHQLF